MHDYLNKVNKLIEDIKTLKETKSELLSVIKHPDVLIQALEGLNELVELEDIKDSLIKEIKCKLISGLAESKGVKKHEFKKLHTVIFGDPGTGKSKTSKYIAMIWYSLGLVNGLPEEKPQQATPAKSLIIHSIRKDKSFAEEATEIYRKMTEIKDLVLQSQVSTKAEFIVLSSSENVSIEEEEDDEEEEEQETEPETPSKNLDKIADQDLISKACEKLSEIGDISLSIIHKSAPQLEPGEAISPSPLKTPISLGIKPKREDVENNIYVVCGREDFVDKYSGHTLPKCKAFVEKHKGKVFIVEEAYLLYMGDQDTYGMEALTFINRYMDEHPESPFVFNGYELLMQKTIFAAQPGLRRRCTSIHTIKGYSPKGLGNILLKQFGDWKVSSSVDLEKFFSSKMKEFPGFGGNTETLVSKTVSIFSESLFDKLVSNGGDSSDISFEIDQELLELGYRDYLKNKPITKEDRDNELISHMYL